MNRVGIKAFSPEREGGLLCVLRFIYHPGPRKLDHEHRRPGAKLSGGGFRLGSKSRGITKVDCVRCKATRARGSLLGIKTLMPRARVLLILILGKLYN